LRGPIGGKNREKEFLVKKLRLKTKTHTSNLFSAERKKILVQVKPFLDISVSFEKDDKCENKKSYKCIEQGIDFFKKREKERGCVFVK
jgi:hypothetical protein